MKSALAYIGAVVLATATGFAGPETIIKQRAKELSNENNVRQDVPPPTQPGVPTPGPATPAPTKLSVSLTKFQTDLGAISPETPASATQKQQLAHAIAAAAQGAKPSMATATKFAEDLAAAAAEKALPSSSRARLAQELDAVLNPGKYPQAKLDGIFADIQAIFQANGLNRVKAVALADDVKAISAEILRGGAASK